MSVNLLALDFDGVFHPANDSVFVGFKESTPAWQIELGLKAQGRFVWAPLLADVLGDSGVSIVIHSTWRKRFDDAVLKTFLPSEVAQRVIVLDGHIKGRRELSSDDYLAEALDIVAPDNLCVLDDRKEFFPENGRVQEWIKKNQGSIAWCDPSFGISALGVRRELGAWLKTVAETDTRFQSPTVSTNNF